MKKIFGALAIAATILGTTGCRMCAPSYDYCGPTDPGSCNDECCGNARRGSIFSGYLPQGSEETIIEEEEVIESPQQPTPPAPPPPPATKQTSYPNSATAMRQNSMRRGR